MKSLEESDLGKVMREFEEAFFDIPFGNSKFQIEHFIINAAHTPERAYRAIGLTMSAKIRALKESYYNMQKGDVDIEELEAKIADEKTSVFDKKRAQIDIEQKKEERVFTKKLINDALAELSCLYRVFVKLPRYTREQFEAGEKNHFKIRLTKQALGISGALESLDNMGESVQQGSLDSKVVKNPKLMDDMKLLE